MLNRFRPLVLCSGAVFLCLFACSEEASQDHADDLLIGEETGDEGTSDSLPTEGGQNSADGGAGGTPLDASDDAECSLGEYAEPSETQLFRSLSAELLENGQPASVRQVQICSFDICLMGEPVVGGDVSFEQPEDLEVLGPAFKVGDGREHATLAYRLPAGIEYDLPPMDVIPLPLPHEGVPLVPGEEAVSNEVTLSLDASAALDFDRLVYPFEDDQLYRVTLAQDLNHPSFEDDSLVIAMAPEGTEICPPASLTVPNPKNWEPGTRVELSSHGAKLQQKHAPYGGFGESVFGVVSDTGDSIFFEKAVGSLGTFQVQRADEE